MTSEERHEARYRRRKAERQRRRDARSEACGSFEQVFSYEHLYRAGRECCKGVGWKCSTQRYLGNFTANIARTHRELMDGTWKTKGFFAFDLMERGKLRHIRSVHIAERVVQRCLCDNALVPLFSAAFVYDNAASLKGKGIDFAMERADLPPAAVLPKARDGRLGAGIRLFGLLQLRAARADLRRERAAHPGRAGAKAGVRSDGGLWRAGLRPRQSGEPDRRADAAKPA